MDVDSILNGCRLKHETHLESIRFSFISSICNSATDVCKQISGCQNELERIQLLKQHFHWRSIDKDNLPYSTKSNEVANVLIIKADEAIKRNNFEDALRCLNISVMFATDNVLGSALVKRAAYFVDMNEEEWALRDIQLAMENKCPEYLLDKLLSKRELLRKTAEMKIKNHSDIHKEIEENQAQFLHLKSPNKCIPNAEEFLAIEYEETCGRKILATKNINAGTLLIAEDPYSKVLTDFLVWDTEHCHLCCKPILGGIPCSDCVFTSYCSEKCRKKAFEDFHRFESKYVAFFHSNPTTCLARDVLSLRTISTVGAKELYKCFRDGPSPLYSDSAKLRGFDKNGIYNSSSYLPICNLISHVSNFRNTQILSNIFKCFVYTEILDDETDFFNEIQYESDIRFSKEIFKDFISSLLLRHMESIPFNAISISQLKDRESLWTEGNTRSNLNEIGTISYGMGLYALLCLCNHSCDPNVIPLRSPNSTRVSVIALRNIAPGEELCICYGPSYHKQNTRDRREFLQSKYNFWCECNACKNDWFNVSSEEKENETILKEDISGVLKGAQQLISEGQFIAALEILQPCLIFLTGKYDDSDPNHFKCTKLCQQLYKIALVWLFNSHSLCCSAVV